MDNRRYTAVAVLRLILSTLLFLPANLSADEVEGADLPGQLDSGTVKFVLGNVEFVLLHELAHLVIHEKDIPILGPEETAADTIAATVLILGERLDQAERQRAISYVLAAAEAFALAWQMGSELGAQVHYWGVHALDIQRYHHIICLLYGSNSEIFNDLPGRAGMPNVRKLDCSFEFERAAKATQWLLREYGRKPDEPLGDPIAIRYGEPDTLVSQRLLQEIKEAGTLENTLRHFRDRFTLSRPMTVVMRRCRQAESAWLPEQRELVVCYELLEGLYQLSRRRAAPIADAGPER